MKKQKNKPQFYTLQELAEILKVQERSVFRYLQSGKLKGQKMGGVWRFTDQSIKDFAKRSSKKFPV
jgi:excisionase family DNA binding protein